MRFVQNTSYYYFWESFCSARVQKGFETQNGFTRSIFSGMLSFVPKLAFLVVEFELWNPPICGIFPKLGFIKNSWNIFLIGFREYCDLQSCFLGVLSCVSNFLCKNAFLEPQKTVRTRNLRFCFKNSYNVTEGIFSVCMFMIFSNFFFNVSS